MTRHLRAARSTDVGKLGAMISQAVAAREWKPQLHTQAEDIAHMGNLVDRGWVTVCEHNDEVAGFLALDGENIQSLYVSNDAQSNGIGAALLKSAQGVQKRLQLWVFQANEDAQRFYMKHGFHEVERTDGAGNEEGLPDMRMIWQQRDGGHAHG